MAGVAMITSSIVLVASSSYSGPCPQHVHLAGLAREVDPSVGRHRRGREGEGPPPQPRLVGLLAAVGAVAGQDAVVVQRVEIAAVEQRGRDVGAAAVVAPGDPPRSASTFGQGQVAALARAHRVDRPHRRVACGDVDHAVLHHRGGHHHLGVGPQGPEQLAVARIVAADGPSVGDQLVAPTPCTRFGVAHVEVSSRATRHTCSPSEAVGGEERVTARSPCTTTRSSWRMGELAWPHSAVPDCGSLQSSTPMSRLQRVAPDGS